MGVKPNLFKYDQHYIYYRNKMLCSLGSYVFQNVDVGAFVKYLNDNLPLKTTHLGIVENSRIYLYHCCEKLDLYMSLPLYRHSTIYTGRTIRQSFEYLLKKVNPEQEEQVRKIIEVSYENEKLGANMAVAYFEIKRP